MWDSEQQVPFAYRDDQWVGFDDERSLINKVHDRILEFFVSLIARLKFLILLFEY